VWQREVNEEIIALEFIFTCFQYLFENEGFARVNSSDTKTCSNCIFILTPEHLQCGDFFQLIVASWRPRLVFLGLSPSSGFYIIRRKIRRFRNWICFHPHVRGDTYSVGSLRKTNLNHWTTHVRNTKLYKHLRPGCVWEITRKMAITFFCKVRTCVELE
jgi:hypothetical protein